MAALLVALTAGACTQISERGDWSFGDESDVGVLDDTSSIDREDVQRSDIAVDRTDALPPEFDTAESDTADTDESPCEAQDASKIRYLTLPTAPHPGSNLRSFGSVDSGIFHTYAAPHEGDRELTALAHTNARTGDRSNFAPENPRELLMRTARDRALVARQHIPISEPMWEVATVDPSGRFRTIPGLRKSRSPSKFNVVSRAFDGERLLLAMTQNDDRGDVSFDYRADGTTYSTRFEVPSPSPYTIDATLVEDGFVARIVDSSDDVTDHLLYWSPDEGWSTIANYPSGAVIGGVHGEGRHVFWTKGTGLYHADLESQSPQNIGHIEKNCELGDLEDGRLPVSCVHRESEDEIRTSIRLADPSGFTPVFSTDSSFVDQVTLDDGRLAWLEYPQRRASSEEDGPRGRIVTHDVAADERHVVDQTYVPICAPRYPCPATRSADAIRAPTPWRLSLEGDVLSWNHAVQPGDADSDIAVAKQVGWMALEKRCR